MKLSVSLRVKLLDSWHMVPQAGWWCPKAWAKNRRTKAPLDPRPDDFGGEAGATS
ncbi:hypothetical protein [Streptomyces panaciradicis]|uniref:hypothetical protein n=1 Tax=Streptomyces panaciradicis TaxID=1470261 RepID=UPI00201D203F|nr:hypothetical protein [Streptomyces panaciradicis]MCL6673997.1 hypothetical protein [Streptomyces panaciradicis]